MAKDNKKIRLAAGIVIFLACYFAAARPVPPETVLVPRWIRSLESETPVVLNEPAHENGESSAELLPFMLGDRFGYVDSDGRFSINRVKTGGLSISNTLWVEYDAEPAALAVFDRQGEAAFTVNAPRGYLFFQDERTFILGNEQNTLTEIGSDGIPMWTYEFAAPLTRIDAAAGLVLTGSIDGIVEILDSTGRSVFSFKPGGSRLPVIVGCALSRDGQRAAIISGIDYQRFLLLERFGGASSEYKVVYHEFLGEGFRRPVHIAFIDSGRQLVFECEGGLGIYEILSRKGRKIPLDGEIAAIDGSGEGGLFFVITSHPGGTKELTGIKLPGRIIMEAPFKSDSVFLARDGRRLLAGGGFALVSFDLEKM